MFKYILIILVSVFFSAFVIAAPNPGVVQITNPDDYRQVLAVSDVHGMYTPLKSLLLAAGVIDKDANWMAGKTLLVVLGDSIDKGGQSVDVLDLWIRLTPQAAAAGGRLVHLLGNHEAELLANGKENHKSKELFDELKQKGIKKKIFLSADSSWGKFLRSLPLAARVGRWLFCHAGFYPELKWDNFVTQASSVLTDERYSDDLLLGEQSILEAKDWWLDASVRRKLLERMSANDIWGIVQGHQPKAYGIKNRVGAIEGGRFIKIDGGMAPEAGANAGGILRFSDPLQMKLSKLPKVETLSSEGEAKELSLYTVNED